MIDPYAAIIALVITAAICAVVLSLIDDWSQDDTDHWDGQE